MGARVVDMYPGGNSAKACGMIEEMKLVSINGVPCVYSPYYSIMTSLRDLDSSAPVQLELSN